MLVVPLSAAIAVRRFESHLGLTGTYFRQADWREPVFTVVDPVIATRELRPRFGVFGKNPFSVTWQGFLAVEKEGRYDLVTRSDDGSTLHIDGSLVVDNGGPHGPVLRAGPIFLTSGFHAIQLQYQQVGGGSDLDITWRSEGRALESIPRTALLRDAGVSWRAYRLVTWTRKWVLLVPFVWLGLLEGWLVRLSLRGLWRFLGQPSSPQVAALAAVLAASTMLNVIGLTWGLPSAGSWAADEVLPVAVIEGIRHRFSGGWYGNYPLFHYFVLAVAYAPFWVLSAIMNAGAEGYIELVWVNRLVSVQMAAATLVVVYAMARDIRGPLAGLVAAASTALLPAFVYYSKTGNLEVPYSFWAICALAFYGRAVMHGSPRDYWRFALFATLAVCTKDQAYGLFVLPAAHLAIIRALQLGRDDPCHWWRIAVDPALGPAILVAVATFGVANNLLFNWAGFVSHVKLLRLSRLYQVYPSTPQGQVQLLVTSLAQFRWLFGWPMACVVALALLMTFLNRKGWPRLWLLSPVVSYYLFFVTVVLYNYDRFFLAISALLAVLVGCWAEDVRQRLASLRLRYGVAAAAWGIAVYSFAYGASIDLMMLFDARYRVEDWISENVSPDARIGTAGITKYLPRIHPIQQMTLDTEGLRNERPEFVVLNGEHMRRYPLETDEGRLFAALKAGSGYRLILQHKTSIPLAVLTRQPEISNRFEDAATNLDKINPEILVFQKIQAEKQ
jgi:hypothetical protein